MRDGKQAPANFLSHEWHSRARGMFHGNANALVPPQRPAWSWTVPVTLEPEQKRLLSPTHRRARPSRRYCETVDRELGGPLSGGQEQKASRASYPSTSSPCPCESRHAHGMISDLTSRQSPGDIGIPRKVLLYLSSCTARLRAFPSIGLCQLSRHTASDA